MNELIPFLADPKKEVRKMAVEYVLGFSKNAEALEGLQFVDDSVEK